MIKNKFTNSIIALGTGASLFLGAAIVPVYAQTAGVSAGVTTAGVSASAKIDARLTKISTRSNQEIDARIADLTKLSARVQDMKNVSDAEKANVATEAQTQSAALTSLKAKIDADTDTATALTDEKSIFGSYRIYALVVPQGYILAASDRVTTISGLLSGVATKLQARITAAQTAGKDVTSLTTTLADMNAKITDANTQAAAAQAKVATLAPDQGNATVAASNKAALLAARADIRVATSDFKAARQDADTIVKGLKAFHLTATASSTTTVAP